MIEKEIVAVDRDPDKDRRPSASVALRIGAGKEEDLLSSVSKSSEKIRVYSG